MKCGCTEKLNIILATNPNNEWRNFEFNTNKYFEDYYKGVVQFLKIDKAIPIYKVLCYQIFGSYDKAFILLTESDKFAQKLFYPINTVPKNSWNPSTYQIITGITVNSNNTQNSISDYYRTLFDSIPSYSRIVRGKNTYCLIINLKIDPNLLLEGGILSIETIENYIEHKLNEPPLNSIKFIITRTFSWCDLNITIFGENPDSLYAFLLFLRTVKLEEINKTKEIRNKTTLKIINFKNGKNTNVFIETQSYFGVEHFAFKGKEKLSEQIKTNIELKVKSGSENIVIELLKKHLNKSFNQKNTKIISGKLDIHLEEFDKKFKISNNQALINLIKQKKLKLNRYINGVKTKIHVPALPNKNVNNTHSNLNGFYENIMILLVGPERLISINKRLKQLKIPRQLKQKVLKVFHSYNNGILDPVMVMLFFDFKFYLDNFERDINSIGKLDSMPIYKIEQWLDSNIRAYEKAFNTRTLNAYMYEDMADIDIDYNASISQLLSIYQFIAIEELKLMSFKIDKSTKNDFFLSKAGFIVSGNLKNTVANAISINYNLHHLTSPEFIFISMHKELLNMLFYKEFVEETKIEKSSNNTIPTLVEEIKKILFSNLSGFPKNKEILDLEKEDKFSDELLSDVIKDLIRIRITFFNDIDLFNYYSFYFLIQNSSLYDSNGMINEEYFYREIRRIIITSAIFNKTCLDNLKCPVPELAYYWNIYTEKIINSVIKINFDELNLRLNSLSEKVLNEIPYKNICRVLELRKLNTEYEDNLYVIYGKRIIKFLSIDNLNSYENKNIISIWESIISLRIRLKESHNINNPILGIVMYFYLKIIFLKNDKKIHILRRSMKSGEPMKCFNDWNLQNYTSFYQLDPQGGIFFNSWQSIKEYYINRDFVLNILTDSSLEIKKEILTKIINK